MGLHDNITADKFPSQGKAFGCRVEVCFHYDTSNVIQGKCVRDDAESPFVSIFQLDDGRVVLSHECQWRFGDDVA